MKRKNFKINFSKDRDYSLNMNRKASTAGVTEYKPLSPNP
jgi:hypothetical protein